jgi:hypothetical protein
MWCGIYRAGDIAPHSFFFVTVNVTVTLTSEECKEMTSDCPPNMGSDDRLVSGMIRRLSLLPLYQYHTRKCCAHIVSHYELRRHTADTGHKGPACTFCHFVLRNVYLLCQYATYMEMLPAACVKLLERSARCLICVYKVIVLKFKYTHYAINCCFNLKRRLM